MARKPTVKPDILESELQRKLILKYKAEGYIVVKVGLCNMPGFPDLMLLKDGVTTFIEVKRPGAKPRPLQEYRHNQLRKAGFSVEIMDSFCD